MALFGAVACVAGPAEAGITLYSSDSDFLAATATLTTVDFNGIADPGDFVGYGNGPLALQGVTFTSNAQLFVIDPGFYQSSYPGGGFLSGDFAGPNSVINAALPGPFTAVGMNFGALFGSIAGATFSFLLPDGTTFVATTSASITGGSLDFIGVTSTVGIISVEVTAPDAPIFNAIDNFSFGTAVTTPAVPEPSSLVLCSVAGIAGLGYARGRRAAWTVLPRRRPSEPRPLARPAGGFIILGRARACRRRRLLPGM